MKKISFVTLCAAVLALCSCAKNMTVNANEKEKSVFDAWISIHYPDAKKTPLGSYIVADRPGTGQVISDYTTYPYLLADYTMFDQDGNVQSSTDSGVAQKVGFYSETDFYGPMVLARGYANMYAGLENAIGDMKIGGTRKVIVPGWLCCFGEESHDADWYLNNGSGTTTIYEITPRQVIADIVKWEVDSTASYVGRIFGKEPSDSVKLGFYYCRTGEPADTFGFKKDTTIYINYIGRLLNGRVFDTNVKDTAILHGIYSSSGTYTPRTVSAKENFSETTMDGNSLIIGFCAAIAQMHSFEKGSAVFISTYGYSTSGSGSTIPAYSPLRFDLEVVAKPD